MPSTCRLLIILLAAMISRSRIYAQSAPAADGGIFSFSETIHDFGKVPADTVVQYTFEFSNSGNTWLIITDISLSCPCFSVNWIRGPVMPGEKGWVSVHYPTTSKPGPFDKILWITSNAANNTAHLDSYELHIKGDVKNAGSAISTPQTKRGKALQRKSSDTILRKHSARKLRK